MTPVFIGIDVGTQGVRVVACDTDGKPLAISDESFTNPGATPDGRHEQDPLSWWTAVVACLRAVSGKIPEGSIQAMSATSTSGTVCFLDDREKPLIPAIMYNDRRADAEGKELNEILAKTAGNLGYRFNSSYALAKILWVKRNLPAIFDETARIVHATDYIVGRLCGNFGITDYTNALKTGYDLIEEKWPVEIEEVLGIPLEMLPMVLPPGEAVGRFTGACSDETGLPTGIPVVAGMTDGCASQVSTGAVSPGDWNSIIGTTLVIKGVSDGIIRDPLGRIYCHRHPDGFWLPGGASNTGGEYIAKWFPGDSWKTLDGLAVRLAPTRRVVYPLCGKGERFPFVNPEAEGFEIGEADEATRFASGMEGVGYVEKLSYETLVKLGAAVGNRIYSAGGGNKSEIWCRMRASILGREILLPALTGGAMGAAVVAASRTYFDGIIQACRKMVRIEKTYEPEPSWKNRYEETYQNFVKECLNRGYIDQEA